MNLAIVGTGTMGKLVYELAAQNHTIEKIWSIEPAMGETLWDLGKSLEGMGPSGVGLVQGEWARQARQRIPEGEGIDVIIDFSHPRALPMIKDYVTRQDGKAALVIATTGYDEDKEREIKELAETVPVLKNSNFSYGINMMKKILVQMSETLGDISDIEIIEKHHSQKIDAPSGTALLLADAIDPAASRRRLCGRRGESRRGNEIGLHSVRGGTIFGEHTVIFAMKDEVIELRHTAFSKEIFAKGAIDAALWIKGREPGYYSFDNMLY
ncbi:MAG TPA: 4-hydroxy-tetrahydrodipicolinate reductase [Anaerovoracaceae bacterium]|nr:4-hydroxy-tetrahydrodipicolinate reductase [Anaerovoracaceae bacterium]